MEQLSILDTGVNIEEQTVKKSARDAFSCCSLYRECSDAKKCLIPEKDYAINCTYREQLEHGTIFFGKSANDFDKSVYRNIVNIYNNLSDDVRYELNCVLVYFKKYTTITLLYNTDAIQQLIKYGFALCIPSKNDKKELLPKLKVNFLKTFLSENDMNKLKIDVQNKRGEKAKINRDDITKYLISNDISSLNEYIKKFIYVYIPHNMIRYMHELYNDFLIGRDDEFKIKLPKYNETGFLKGKVK